MRDRGEVALLTSEYAAEEARRNLDSAERRAALAAFLGSLLLVPDPAVPPPAAVRSGLPEDDVPILAAAIAARATHLLTGDLRHFGPLLGRRIAGVRILTPAEYLGP